MLGQDCPNEIEETREHSVKKLQLLHEGRRRRRRRRGLVHVAAIILVKTTFEGMLRTVRSFL